MKSWFIWKDPHAGKDWRQGEKGATEDEMVEWHHQLDEHEFEQAPGVGDWLGGLVCCSPWGCRVGHDWATELKWTELNWKRRGGQVGHLVWKWTERITVEGKMELKYVNFPGAEGQVWVTLRTWTSRHWQKFWWGYWTSFRVLVWSQYTVTFSPRIAWVWGDIWIIAVTVS